MPLSLATNTLHPPKILLYGVEGIGKTTFGSKAEKPVFLPTEKGLAAVHSVPQYPVAKSLTEFMGYINELATEDHDYKTLVIDSLDWLEPLIWKQVCQDNAVDNIEKAGGGYGKGWAFALDHWNTLIQALDYLNEEKEMMIILIAHAKIKEYKNPETEPYDRYSLKLQDGKNISAAAKMMEYPDINIFANYFVGVKKVDNQNTRGVGSGERSLFTEERPAFKAKNRFGLPDTISFDKNGDYWKTIKKHVPFYNIKKEKK